MFRIGIDLGGTKIESVLLDENLNVLQQKRIQTPQSDYFKIIDSISSLVLELSE
ncbi:MAG TPA: ROK family protein, partial [Nitrosopumilus sp.]|nr:ROK family protein [Nitrosopumilus sp.]